MRGRPLLEWCLLLVLWLGLLWPLTALTGRRDAPSVTVQEEATQETRNVWASLRFSSPPVRFVVRQGDHVLWEGQGMHHHETLMDPAAFDARLELRLLVEWDEAASSRAVEFTLEPDGLPSRSQTLWTDQARLERVVPFVW